MSSLSSLVTNRCPGSMTPICDRRVTVTTGRLQYTHETGHDTRQPTVRKDQAWPACRRSAFAGRLVFGIVPVTRYQATEEDTDLEQQPHGDGEEAL